MTLALAPGPQDPANPDRPWPWPTPPVPSTQPTPRVALRIGHAPRLPRWVRSLVVTAQMVAFTAVGAGVVWTWFHAGPSAGISLAFGTAALTLMHSHTPKQASPSAPTGAVLAVHSGRVLRGALAGLPSGMPPAT